MENFSRAQVNPKTGKPLNPNFSVQDDINTLVVETGFNRLRLTVSAFQKAIKSSNKPKAFLLSVAATVLIPALAITQVVNKYVLKPLFKVSSIALVLAPIALLSLLAAPLYAKDFVINLGQRPKQAGAGQEPTAQPERYAARTAKSDERRQVEPPRHFLGLFPEETAAAPSATATKTLTPTSSLAAID